LDIFSLFSSIFRPSARSVCKKMFGKCRKMFFFCSRTKIVMKFFSVFTTTVHLWIGASRQRRESSFFVPHFRDL
jgi:hypothetical protein